MSHASAYFDEVCRIASALDHDAVERLASALVRLREQKGRLFLLGVGGSAANCSHAVNDFRKLCGIQASTPTDNVSELTARINDEGWENVFSDWLLASNASANDAVLVFSVGGGDADKNISPNIVSAVKTAKKLGMLVMGIVGRNGGYTKQEGDIVVVVPTVDESRVTPHSEGFQAVIWHCIVSHPSLQMKTAKWESVSPKLPLRV